MMTKTYVILWRLDISTETNVSSYRSYLQLGAFQSIKNVFILYFTSITILLIGSIGYRRGLNALRCICKKNNSNMILMFFDFLNMMLPLLKLYTYRTIILIEYAYSSNENYITLLVWMAFLLQHKSCPW